MKTKGYFNSFLSDMEKAKELQELLKNIEENSDLALLKSILDLNSELSNNFAYVALSQTPKFL